MTQEKMAAIRQAADKRYEVDFEGWILRGYAYGERQAKYRAWKTFTKEFGTPFIRFMRSARVCEMHQYQEFGCTPWDLCGRKIAKEARHD